MFTSLLIFICILFSTEAFTTTYLQLETGAVWQSRNDVQIPPDEGTYLEFDKLEDGPYPHFRLDGEWMWDERQGIRFLLAPFRVSVTGRPPQDIRYREETFSASEDLTVNYQFDSYRVGYFYEWPKGDSALWRLGGTGKIRVAKIELEQGDISQKYTNTGFVPLFYAGYQQRFLDNWIFYTDMDFSAAPQGRAFDLAVKLKRWIDEKRQWGFGFRTLEGGADNDKVVTWSWFNYLVLDYGMVL